jgi:AcrR family transcriptional regulator
MLIAMLSVPERRRRLTRDEKKAQTRLQLLQAAATVFPRRGYHATSVDEVAEEAGFTVGALYSNFSGKQDLFLAMLDEHFARQMAVYAEISSRGHTVEAKARGAAGHWMQFLQGNPQFFPLFIEFWGLALRDQKLRRQLSSRMRNFRKAISDLLKRDADELGVELPDDAADGLAMVVNSMGNGLALHMLVDPQAVPKDLFGNMMALIFTALRQMYDMGAMPAVPRATQSVPKGTN